MERTPKSQRRTKSSHAKKQEYNVNNDFMRNVFNLLAASYSMPSESQIPLKFKDEEKEPQEDKSQAFQSRIVDLRLRRQQEQLVQYQIESNQKISGMIEDIAQKLKENSEDIDEVFEPEKAERFDVPLYLRNTDYDRKREDRYNREIRSPHKPMNMKNIQREYTNRLERAQVIGTARAEKRYYKMQMHALENNVYGKPNTYTISND